MTNYHLKTSDNAEVIKYYISIFTQIMPTPLFSITNVVTYTVTNISPFQKPFVKRVRNLKHFDTISRPIKISQMTNGMTKHTQINSQKALKMAKKNI